MIITIDGPVASGKSSVAKVLAEQLNIYYLYTGLLYRAIAYILKHRFELDAGNGVITQEEFAAYVRGLKPTDCAWIQLLVYDYGKDNSTSPSRPYIFFENKEITSNLFDAALDQYASIVSASPHVRAALMDLQQSLGKKHSLVADGRDCGSIIFPKADYKFFLTASVEVRAQRLMLDATRSGVSRDIETVKAEIEARDKRDRERAVAPLTIPEGAILIDSSNLSFQETVNKFLAYIHV